MGKVQNIFPLGVLLWLCFLPANSLAISTTNITTTDQSALLSLMKESNHILAKNWSVGSSVCEWIGVTCGSRHRRVTALNISNMGFTGLIPPELGNLSFLVSLDMSINSFSGELPPEFARLHRLKFLDLGVNKLSGVFPSWIGSFQELEFLSLRNNSFTGPIPPSVSNMSKLTTLRLQYNSLEGNIPGGLFTISSLEIITLIGNSLSGSIPDYICYNLRKLRWLNLSRNKLKGQILSSLDQCSQLQTLSLSFNNFTGIIPREIWNLKELEVVILGRNNFQGEIPREIGNSTMLKTLDLGHNYLTGVIPREIGNLQNLENLLLQFNSLTGSIPHEIFNLSMIQMISLPGTQLSGNLPSRMCSGVPNLEHLYLGGNNFSGDIPKSITNCSNLIDIDLSENQFTGPIPNSFGDLSLLEILTINDNNLVIVSSSPDLVFINSLANCKYLRVLAFSNNQLNGTLPVSVGNLSASLETFFADQCNIKGSIPDGIGNLSSLITLDFSDNQLIGSMPSTIKDLQNLQQLDLTMNQLRRVPLDVLCFLKNLGTLYLGQNQISGLIPECLGNLTSLRYLYLYSNRLNSTLPTNIWNLKDLLELNLSSNSLSGSLPPEIKNLKSATMIDFSMNYLSGEIPNTIGDMLDMKFLLLAQNQLQGSIPVSIGKMLSLETLDLSHNFLIGSIPKSLDTLLYLTYFNVSFNNLSGEIPSNGPFQNFTNESFISNGALCGAPRFNVPPCPSISANKSRTKRVYQAIFISLGLLVAVVGAMIFGLICLRYRRKKKVINDQEEFATQERISYYQLLQATDGYNNSNLLGTGSFGSVYRGTLDDGRIVAVKVFNLQLEGTFESFDTECEVLRNLRHRNLTGVVTSCSNPEFKALVLEYMPNGNLENWLHSDNHFLDIMLRLDILIDVARALEYLHFDYLTPVVHCDLKPSNVLLDEDMVAHLSDFGIAKLLGQEDSITLTKTLATLGYLAPEYGMEGLVSTKCDVYSFGIMTMEVFTRKNPSHEMFGGNLTLKSWVNDSMPDALADTIDANLLKDDEQYSLEKLNCISSIMKVALNCTRESPRERCNIQDVLVALKKVKIQLQPYIGV